MESVLSKSVDFSSKRVEQVSQDLTSKSLLETANTNISHLSMLRETVDEFVNVLGHSSINPQSLDDREFMDSIKWNSVFLNIQRDLEYLYDIYGQLATFEISAFNRHTSLYGGLRTFIADTGLLSVDTSLASGLRQHAVFVAGDGFSTTNGIDPASTAEPAFGSAGVTLAHVDSSRIPVGNTELEILYEDNAYVNADGRFALFKPYEGNLYAEQGLARPEGGRFRFQKTLPPGSRQRSGEIQKTKVVTKSGGLFNAVGNEFNRVANRVGGALGVNSTVSSILVGVVAVAVTGGLGLAGAGLGYLANRNKRNDTGNKQYIPDTQIYLAEPTEGELRAQRNLMLDDDPSTFWEIERCVQLGVKDEAELLEPSLPEESLRKAREFKEDFPGQNLTFTIKANFKKMQAVNWVNVDPVRFHPTADVAVRSIKFKDADGNFRDIPNFNRFSNYLTEQANNKVGEDTSNRLGINSYDFGGQGLWVFPTIETDELYIDIEIDTSYVSPYDLYAFQLVKKTTVKKSGTSIGGVKLSSDKKEEITKTQTVRLPYVEGLSIFEGFTDLNESADETQSTADITTGTDVAVAGLSLLSFGGKSVTSTGWKVSESWQETRTDVFRFAAGIKELGLYYVNYAESSVLISKEHKIPVPAVSATLEVDTTIPDGYGLFNWIQYYISVDGGSQWVEIAPKAQDVVMDNQGSRVNKLVRFVGSLPNEEAVDPRITYAVTDRPVTSIMFRAVLNRPAGNSEVSPILNSYSLVMATNETLSELL